MMRGEIWWVNFEPAIGSEIRKTRPAIIISNDIANKNLSRVVVVPLTSKIDKVYPGECLVDTGNKMAKAMSDQIQAVDKRRLSSKMGILSASNMVAVEEALKLHLALF